MTLTVAAGGSRGASGGWVRPLAEAGRVMVPTVAHILYDRAGRLRPEVRIGGAPARVHALVRLPGLHSARADAALIEPDPVWAASRVEPAPGHLSDFVPGFAVRCRLPGGGVLAGRLLISGWAGRMNYSFGPRRVTGQWIVAVERDAGAPSARPIRRGDSGLLWSTEDGTAVGLQIGVLMGRPDQAIVTPFATICDLFGVRAAA